MSSLALNAVQPALYSKLTGDGVLMGMIAGVYDAPPQHANLPYVVIGDGTVNEVPQVSAAISECTLNLHVWTKGGGRKSALAILNRLYGLLHHGSMTVTGFTLIAMRAGQAQTQVIAEEDRVFGILEITVTVSES